MNEKLYDEIASTCEKVLEKSGLTEEEIWKSIVFLTSRTMSKRSKEKLEEVILVAPVGLEKAFHMAFLSGYQCGDGDRIKKGL